MYPYCYLNELCIFDSDAIHFHSVHLNKSGEEANHLPVMISNGKCPPVEFFLY